MRKQGMYRMCLQIKTIRFAILPCDQITLTLRVGRNSATTTFNNHNNVKREVDVNSTIQLNIDSTALQAQRCSLTLNSLDNKKIMGIALISIPKDKNQITNTYRLTQNEDKRAQVDLKITIRSFDSSQNKTPIMELNSQSSNNDQYKQSSSTKSINHIYPKIYINNIERIDSADHSSNVAIHSMSKISDQLSNIYSQDKKSQVSKSYKVREEVRILQIPQNQIKRYKQEKQAYYQLYQIQKGKNQIAIKFINNFIKKVTEKFPALASSVIESFQQRKSTIDFQQGDKKTVKNQQQNDSAIINQLEQANRSLHRQVDQYKKIVEELKLSLTKKNGNLQVNIKQPENPKKNNNFLSSCLLEFQGSVSRVGEMSVIRPSNQNQAPTPKNQPRPNSSFKDMDIKKWINLSIQQRAQLQDILRSTGQNNKDATSQSNTNIIRKIKINIDKSFTNLLAKKQLTRDGLIIHRKEVNRVFQQILMI